MLDVGRNAMHNRTAKSVDTPNFADVLLCGKRSFGSEWPSHGKGPAVRTVGLPV